ncbi:hypothetical protein A0H81_06168 [Grifola frondosa]|uniref:Uncharacterized protein n=1 Tax=Grifola frondosa TaxID=5627 RepID=A0A1C7MBR5_GRIFR|nr:hypothetical protein A0H81_06168 [Grifola frondosa]
MVYYPARFHLYLAAVRHDVSRVERSMVNLNKHYASLNTNSSATLDIKDILAANPCDSILSSLLTVSSTLDSIHSFEDVPCFPTGHRPKLYRHRTTAPVLVPTARPGSGGTCTSEDSEATIAAPTEPRLKAMIMETICVDKWAASTHSSPGEPPPLEEIISPDAQKIAPPWIPDGSIFPPEAFQAIFRNRRVDGSNLPSKHFLSMTRFGRNPVGGFSTVSEEDTLDPRITGLRVPDEVAMLTVVVPTITISNSTAVLPFSLESSQNLAHVPLAVRRGQKVPTTLLLKTKEPEADVGDDPYPGIPTPFLGSPSSYSPTFEFAKSPSTFSMGLDAMCANLMSKCPELRPEGPSTPPAEPEGRWATVPCAQYSADSDDEWAFAKELLDQYGASAGLCAELSPPVSPPGDLPYAADPANTADVDSLSWETTPSSSNQMGKYEEMSPASLKQLRRKTVIIETSERILPLPTVDPSSPIYGQFDKPVPFETPVDDSFSPATCLQSTPPHSRPSSSASLKPVRGILKEKKSVRFSTVPSLHEYPVVQHELSPRVFETSPKRVMQRSPLRQSYSADTAHTASNAHVANNTPKHPAARALMRNPKTPSIAQTPTALSTDQRRTPLRSINTRQSLPTDHSAGTPVPMVPKGARKSVSKADGVRRGAC